MSTAAMKTRLDRIEDAVMPKPQQKVTVLMAPSPRASVEEVAAHEAKLAEATAAGDKILVIHLVGMTKESVRLKSLAACGIDCVEYFADPTDAALRAASLTPSTKGGKNALDDILQGLSGNVIGPVSNPPPQERRG